MLFYAAILCLIKINLLPGEQSLYICKNFKQVDFSQIAIKEILTVSFTLFAVIDMVGNIPVLASLRLKMGGEIRSTQATLASGALMILFLLIGKQFLGLLGLDVQSFAVAGSIVIFRSEERRCRERV